MHSVTTFYRAVIRMMELNEQSGPPVQQLDDSALAEELQIQVQQLIVQHPEIVPLPARVGTGISTTGLVKVAGPAYPQILGRRPENLKKNRQTWLHRKSR